MKKGTKYPEDKVLRGSKKPSSKLTEEQIPSIRKMLLDGKSRQQIATKFGVGKSIITRIALGKGWAHV